MKTDFQWSRPWWRTITLCGKFKNMLLNKFKDDMPKIVIFCKELSRNRAGPHSLPAAEDSDSALAAYVLP